MQYRDPTEFRKRFALYKEGKNPYENGLPKYELEKNSFSDELAMDYILQLENPNGDKRKPTIGFKNGKLPRYEDGKPNSKRARALYNHIDPRRSMPNGYADAVKMEAEVRRKMYLGNPDKMDYELGDDLPSKVSDAAWRKRLGYSYDQLLLPANGNSVRLPYDIEKEIPTDTTFLKNRIKATEDLMKYSNKYKYNKYVRLAKLVDQEALDALRETYKTGRPVTINENSYNSRLWVNNGNIEADMSPLNVLQNYTILYNPNTNTIDYSDIYDFNEYDWAIPGEPFNIKGSIKLNPKK